MKTSVHFTVPRKIKKESLIKSVCFLSIAGLHESFLAFKYYMNNTLVKVGYIYYFIALQK